MKAKHIGMYLFYLLNTLNIYITVIYDDEHILNFVVRDSYFAKMFSTFLYFYIYKKHLT